MANSHSLSLELDNSQAVRNISPYSGLNTNGDLTIEAWINPETLPATGVLSAQIVHFGEAGAVIPYSMFYDDTYIKFFHDNSTNNETVQVAYSLSTSTWTHLAVTVATSTVKFYVNGSQQGSNQTLTYSRTTASSPYVTIGANAVTTQEHDGLVDEVRVWGSVRTEQQINDYKSSELPSSGMLGYWKFNNSLVDYSGNATTLTGVNAPTFSTDVPFIGDSSSYFFGM